MFDVGGPDSTAEVETAPAVLRTVSESSRWPDSIVIGKKAIINDTINPTQALRSQSAHSRLMTQTITTDAYWYSANTTLHSR